MDAVVEPCDDGIDTKFYEQFLQHSRDFRACLEQQPAADTSTHDR